MRRIIGGWAMASASLSHRKALSHRKVLSYRKALSQLTLLTERSRRQKGMLELKEMLG
jgi:hypothetical protein